jgi:hypothetical protein
MRLQEIRSSITRRLLPTRHPSWQEFAVRVRGEFRPSPFWRTDEVVTRFDRWLLHLDTVMLDRETGVPKSGLIYSTRRGTEVWARFTSVDGFRFAVRDRQWLHRNPNRLEWEIDPGRLVDAVLRRTKPEETEIGDARFDGGYVARSNHPAKLQRLLTEGSTIERILDRSELAEIRIVGPDPGEDMFAQQASLLLWERQMLQDPEQLLDLHELLLGLLDCLARMGSAAPAAAEEG